MRTMKVRTVLSRRLDRLYRDKPRRQQILRLSLSYAGVAVFICAMMLLLNACTLFPGPSQGSKGDDSADNTSAYNTTSTQIASASPTVKPGSVTFQGMTGCPSGLTVNWDRLVGTKANVNKVQKVICGPIENGAVAALVNVRYYSADARLDFYVYDNLSGTPSRRFVAQGLAQGDAQISPTNTIITAQNANNDPLGVNLFKEYQWDGSTFAQIVFPGLFPDVTHYQAEQAQAQVNAQLAQVTATPGASANSWQSSAFPVVSRLAQNVFHWSPSMVQNSVVTYNSRDAIYVIKTTNYGPGGGGFIATLFRLDNVATNIFEVKEVTSIDGTMLLTSPASGVQVTSPIRVSGSYQSAGTILGRVVLYDDTFVSIADTGAIHGSASTGNVSFSPSVSYHLSPRGLQEGLVALYVTNQNNIAVSNQVLLVKVLFSA